MTVANHVSWLDIPALAALEATRFVSKSEVRDWPVAGWLAVAAGTFFLRRGKGGKMFYSCSRYPECTYASNTPPVAEPELV